MTRFIAHRAALGLLVVVGVVILTFVIARVIPGDPATEWVGPHASPQQLARVVVAEIAAHETGPDFGV